jgi:hypothetical protein
VAAVPAVALRVGYEEKPVVESISGPSSTALSADADGAPTLGSDASLASLEEAIVERDAARPSGDCVTAGCSVERVVPPVGSAPSRDRAAAKGDVSVVVQPHSDLSSRS